MPVSTMKKSTFKNGHMLTILFHIILSICILIFAHPSFSPVYTYICGGVLFVVSVLAFVPIYNSLTYPFTIVA